MGTKKVAPSATRICIPMSVDFLSGAVTGFGEPTSILGGTEPATEGVLPTPIDTSARSQSVAGAPTIAPSFATDAETVLYYGDCLEGLRTVPDGAIQLIVTS